MVASTENLIGNGISRGYISNDYLLAFGNHDAINGTSVVGGAFPTPAERFNLESLNTIGESTMDPDHMMAKLAEVVKRECAAHNLATPRISIEPGRAIVGPTTTTLYTVGTTKSVDLDGGSTRRYIAVDGGMSDNIRPALYGAEYTALLANRTSTATPTSSRLVGKHCESGDILIREIDLPSDIGADDILAIPATGAYCRSMASNYNHVGRPAVVAVKAGSARTILRRETEADLLALDVIEAPRTIR